MYTCSGKKQYQPSTFPMLNNNIMTLLGIVENIKLYRDEEHLIITAPKCFQQL